MLTSPGLCFDLCLFLIMQSAYFFFQSLAITSFLPSGIKGRQASNESKFKEQPSRQITRFVYFVYQWCLGF